MKVAYYFNDELYVACLETGSKGMFVYRTAQEQKGWEFVLPGTVMWDSFHQEIYRNYRYDYCRPDKTKDLPALPDIPLDSGFVEWHENFIPEDLLNAADYPNIEHLLSKHPLRIFFILYEVRYETMFGDGKFLYYDHKVFFSEKDAEAYSSKKTSPKDFRYYYVRSIEIEIKNGFLVSSDFKPQMYEHYTLDEIIKDFEMLPGSKRSLIQRAADLALRIRF